MVETEVAIAITIILPAFTICILIIPYVIGTFKIHRYKKELKILEKELGALDKEIMKQKNMYGGDKT